MRPRTLSEACDRIRDGDPPEEAISEVLDTFYGAPDAERRFAVIADAPILTGNDRLDAFFAAAAEYLAHQYRLDRVPSWTADPKRILRQPWFTTVSEHDGIREYLTHSSPAEFSSRNIFTEERPLRRASQARSERIGVLVPGA